MSRFYELKDDRRSQTRWHLGAPRNDRGEELDPWQFRQGQSLALEGVVHFPLKVPGDALDFCWAAFAIPVVHARVATLLERLGAQDVQLIPARVEGRPETYFILNALRIIRCIDDARCTEVQYWKPEDEEPEKLGEYRSVIGLRIDPSRVGNARIFRTWGWRVALIVSEDIKEGLASEGLSGMRFAEV
ncbi:imm11 family protein [Hyalangium gracile]|uniref:imm11 family protein n=1 Tax=Hyalangium gracile TaxID=394092 RepID=UPI001CCB3FA3|nr:DUF1629 domain-containing protein [Hyalangium gracile]